MSNIIIEVCVNNDLYLININNIMIKINVINIYFIDFFDSVINMKLYMNIGIVIKVYFLIDILFKCCMNNVINIFVDNVKK